MTIAKRQLLSASNQLFIEGSCLTHDQTCYIFEANTTGLDGQIANVDDVVETANHFLCIDLVINNATKPLTETFIKNCTVRSKMVPATAASPGLPLVCIRKWRTK